MSRVWTCRKCRVTHSRVTQKCGCGQKRPAPRRPKHASALDLPYEQWVEQFGEVCGICGRPPGPHRRLDRDHSHAGEGFARGLLCHRCNRALGSWVTPEWLRAAAAYLERSNGSGTRNATGSTRV